MRVRGFISSLVFGALAALVSVFAWLVLGPVVGVPAALGLYLAACLVAYAAALAEGPRQAVGHAAFAAAGAAVVLFAARDLASLSVGLSLVLAGVRTGLSPGRHGLRGVAIEVGLTLGALGFAALLFSPGPLGMASAIWGYALVTSLFFLVSVSREGTKRAGDIDPFDRARDRLLGLLEEA